MSQRYNTDNPVPSSVLTDLNDNLLTIDEFVNNSSGETSNRKGESFPVLQVQVEARIDEITTAGQQAIVSADQASQSAAEAELSNQSSQTAMTAAQVAAGNAQSISDGGTTFYITPSDPDGTIAGLSGTTSGNYFRVAQGTGSEISFIYYLNNAGVALAVAKQVGQAAMDEVKSQVTQLNSLINKDINDEVLRVVDVLGYRQFYALINGEFGTKFARVKPDGIELDGFKLLVSDEGGGIYVENTLGQKVTLVDDNGFVAPRSLRILEGNSFGTDAAKLSNTGVSFDLGASRIDISGPEFLKVADLIGRAKTIIDKEGNLVGANSGDGLTLQDRIDILNAENLNYYSKVRSRYNSDIERLVFALTLIIGDGQSLETSQEGYPALSTTVYENLGNLMFGDSPRPNSRTAANFNPVGSAVLNPLKAVVQTSDGSAIMTDSAVSALPASSPNEGEGMVSAVNMLRSLWLRHINQLTDSARSLILASCGVNGRTIEALSKGASPELYNRVREAVTKIKAIADAQGKTFGIGGIFFDQGQWNYNPTYGGTESREGWKALLIQLYNDIVSDFCSNQNPPALFLSQTGAGFTSDANELSIGMAQLDLALLGGNFYGSSTTYQLPDKGFHLTSNGYRWRSQQDAKVAFRVLILGEGWEPLHCIKAVILGNVGLLCYAVPAPPLQWGTPYVGRTATTYVNKGYRATDDNGTLSITSVEIAADTVVKLNFNRDAVGTVKIWYADKTVHGGNGCLKDSDPFVATENYVYIDGSGQYTDENILELVNKPYPLNNWAWAQVVTVSAG
ncbi:hypothetical protein Rahaq_5015 (plasmid) [Rahnella aceris]|uniref:Flagellar biosynthesis, cell-distal portion of basal-body rod n=1 Tax=Rahnella sp. (strain Y9602) TaxID=2703885 RepID=A0A0H3FIK6_RAHSY|nr:hypothetical protein [Rahnella aceris]ADW76590.1 hypothetical protein Rahaq_5015 [Rahnella aceris]